MTARVPRTGDTTDATEAVVADVCRDAAGVHGDVGEVVGVLVDRRAPLANRDDRNRLIGLAVARLAGLDVLEQHLHDPDVDEVMVNGGGDVWVDRRGELVAAGRLPEGAVDVVVERVLAPTGRRADRTSPIVDVRLPDGARLCAVVDPIAIGGTALAIRRHRHRSLPLTAFTDQPTVAALLREIVTARCNVLVSGATSSGKTSLVGTLLAHAAGDRLVVCEDTAELALDGHHAVRLEARPASADGPDAVDLARLVRTALRLRPDRLVVGEFRGVEVLAAVEAMNTGHDGSFSTCHAHGALDALARVETLLMQAAPTWPLAAIRRQVTRSLDVVVHVQRLTDGTRRIGEVVEIVTGDGTPAAHVLATASGVQRRLGRRRGVAGGPEGES